MNQIHSEIIYIRCWRHDIYPVDRRCNYISAYNGSNIDALISGDIQIYCTKCNYSIEFEHIHPSDIDTRQCSQNTKLKILLKQLDVALADDHYDWESSCDKISIEIILNKSDER